MEKQDTQKGWKNRTHKKDGKVFTNENCNEKDAKRDQKCKLQSVNPETKLSANAKV